MDDCKRLAEDEKIRYHRQIILPEWGEKAQIKLKNSVVFITGVGGPGSPVIFYLVSGGQVTFMHPPGTPCLSCLVPEVVSTENFPILGATAGVVGSLGALEAVKFITGTGSLLKNRILFWNGKEMRFHVSREDKNALNFIEDRYGKLLDSKYKIYRSLFYIRISICHKQSMRHF